jgi:hypothetical protein
MKTEEIERLIELLISAHEECYECEGVCFLSTEEETELNKLIEKYKIK